MVGGVSRGNKENKRVYTHWLVSPGLKNTATHVSAFETHLHDGSLHGKTLRRSTLKLAWCRRIVEDRSGWPGLPKHAGSRYPPTNHLQSPGFFATLSPAMSLSPSSPSVRHPSPSVMTAVRSAAQRRHELAAQELHCALRDSAPASGFFVGDGLSVFDGDRVPAGGKTWGGERPVNQGGFLAHFGVAMC